MSRARDAGLDLVEVAPNSKPPVCKVMDFGKWLYEQKKKNKQSQKKQHVVHLKEVRLRPKIDPHDLGIKVKKARKFLEKGDKVQFSMLFRGREMIHVDHGHEMMKDILETIEDLAKVERPPKMAGRRLTMVVAPDGHK
ncbi:Translation initiation factor IF-3 [Anaerohalosphaera lusitana]|uniref:Translation initiation factor IF-3 n=1 Tax=Anaerohalosphaera lusitana TaxID=1936003 RepID=A0A1U9NM99_9BACT|nr:Translation initiation factor IF-3 [Anaerohalosphaera lusitana]